MRDPEIKFGYAITGLVDPARMLTNAGGRRATSLVLTKPLGTGIIATALKAGPGPRGRGRRPPTRSMARSTATRPRSALAHGVRAATDVTGFGLVGHAAASRARAGSRSRSSSPRCRCCRARCELAQRYQPGGLKANRRQFEPLVEYAGAPDEALRALLFDPQTSGGLLPAGARRPRRPRSSPSCRRRARIGRAGRAGAPRPWLESLSVAPPEPRRIFAALARARANLPRFSRERARVRSGADNHRTMQATAP